jgi:hypothetical protein
MNEYMHGFRWSGSVMQPQINFIVRALLFVAGESLSCSSVTTILQLPEF